MEDRYRRPHHDQKLTDSLLRVEVELTKKKPYFFPMDIKRIVNWLKVTTLQLDVAVKKLKQYQKTDEDMA